MPETFHIETIAAEGGGVIRRVSVRADSPDKARDRALRLLKRARVPQATGPAVDAVRVIDGAGYEVFSASVRDEA